MKALASKAGSGIDVVSLATFLAREKMVGADSRFQPFIEVLPWDSLHPLLWTEAELDLLEGTYAFNEINDLLDQVLNQFPLISATYSAPRPTGLHLKPNILAHVLYAWKLTRRLWCRLMWRLRSSNRF